MNNLREDLAELTTAEEFLGFFQIPYEQRVVDRCRLHILQRAHDYLVTAGDAGGGNPDGSDAQLRDCMRAMLERAYLDFTASSPLQERVFKVLRDAQSEPAERRSAFVPLDALVRPRGPRSDQ
ncbi:MAG: nitrogenase-stabilizing/protective protein NifW [Hyphomicrobium sp.]